MRVLWFSNVFTFQFKIPFRNLVDLKFFYGFSEGKHTLLKMSRGHIKSFIMQIFLAFSLNYT